MELSHFLYGEHMTFLTFFFFFGKQRCLQIIGGLTIIGFFLPLEALICILRLDT